MKTRLPPHPCGLWARVTLDDHRMVRGISGLLDMSCKDFTRESSLAVARRVLAGQKDILKRVGVEPPTKRRYASGAVHNLGLLVNPEERALLRGAAGFTGIKTAGLFCALVTVAVARKIQAGDMKYLEKLKRI